MRQALLAMAGLAIGFAAATQPAAAQSGWWSDPMNGREMQYLDDDSRAQSSPIPRQRVEFSTKYAPGTIVISTSERRLYYVTQPGEAIEYGVGVGRPGFEWTGVKRVSAKKEWPSWTPPAEMLQRRPDLPRYMSGGPDNPLGARAMYLGSSLYRIHGSNEPETIGQAVSSGCIRMTNEDVIDLYNRVKVGAKVVVLD
jgi:lipoprotein-anchoring transpeptidase ErfK/SrfK